MSLDNFKNRTIIWDTVDQDFPQPIQIMQGDVNARTLLIKIVDNGVEIDLTGHSLKLTYQYTNNDNSGFVVAAPNNLAKGEFILVIPTEMTKAGVIEANLILLNEDKEQVIVSKNLTFISDNSTVTSLAQEVNNKIDDFTKLLLENMPQVLRSELNDLHAQTESNKSNIELKANLADVTSLRNALTIPSTITQANFVLSKAIDGTGVEITANAKFLLSGAITPYADKITLTNITNVAPYLLYQLSYYNLAGTFISQSTWIVVSNNEILLDASIDYTTVRIGLITSTTTSTKQMVYWTSGAYPNRTFTLNFKKLVANADNNNYGFVKPDGITTYIESGLLKAHPSGNAVNPDNLITVAKSNGMETVVQEAIRKCTNDDTIVIYPGTYDEQLNTADNTYGNKSTFKSLVGVDREKCIITSHKDDYGVEALWVSKGYFKNLSVLADDTADVAPARNAYAMHADNNWLVNSKAIFENCYFYSKTTAAIGIGTRPGCDIIFRNCKFYTEHNLNAGGSHVGAVFFHNSNDRVNKGPNQRLTFDNCEIISKYGSAMKVQRVGDDTNTVELTMKNCSLWSEETGLTNVITIDDTLYTGVSGNNININGKTFGNNVDITTFIHA